MKIRGRMIWKWIVALLVSGIFCLSCIKNDIPYPVIPLRILTFEVDGQEGNALIDNNTRTVTVTLADTVNLKNVMVKRCLVTEGIEAPLDSAELLDLSSPKSFVLSLYQDYEWTIRAEQTIERKFSVNKQVGKTVFNSALHQAVAYISSSASQKAVQIKELKLGPEGITIVEPALEGIVDFSLPKQVTVRYHDIVEEWTVMVSKSDKNISTGEADAWVNVAWLHGNGEEGADNGFEIRESSKTEWERVAKTNVTDDEGELTACVSGLKALTTYVYRAYSADDYGDEMTFTTGEIVALPGGSFDDWHKVGKVWYPWAEGGTPIWDSGNEGSTTLGESNTLPSDDIWSGKKSGQSAKLESKFVGLGSIGKFAAGNLFIGTFKGVDGTNGILDFGRPFTARPTKLKGHYKYVSAPINYASAEYSYLKGVPDTCSVYIALGDWDSPLEIRTKPSDRQLFDKNDKHIIAYAEFNSGESVMDYTDLELTLQYRATNRVPTYIMVVCSASKYGDFFTGGAGSVLYVDEFSLEYDY